MTAYYQTSSDGPVLSDAFSFGLGYALGDTVTTGDMTSWQWKAGAAISDVATIGVQLSIQTIYHITYSERAAIYEALTRAIPAVLLQTLTVQDFTKVVRGVVVLEKLFARDALVGSTVFTRALVQAIAFDDALGTFLGGFLGEEIGIGDVVARQYQAGAQVGELAILTDLLANWMIFNLEVDDTFDIQDEHLLKMIYAGDPLLDGVKITCGWFQPSGSFTTWVVNTRTSAVTEYRDFVFNSFAQLGRQFLGANEKGLWLLNGELDEATSIAWRIKTGLMSIGGSHFTSFKAIYLGMRVRDNAANFFVKLRTGDEREYVYRVKPRNMETTKIDLGKGLRSRYFSFELESTGPAGDLDSVEFVPITTQRRVD